MCQDVIFYYNNLQKLDYYVCLTVHMTAIKYNQNKPISKLGTSLAKLFLLVLPTCGT